MKDTMIDPDPSLTYCYSLLNWYARGPGQTDTSLSPASRSKPFKHSSTQTRAGQEDIQTKGRLSGKDFELYLGPSRAEAPVSLT